MRVHSSFKKAEAREVRKVDGNFRKAYKKIMR